MNKQKILFLIIITLLFINLIALDLSQTKTSGKIKKIQYSTNKITITLTTSQTPYIIFTNKILNIKEKDHIIITGQKSSYKNQPQIIINKITKIIPHPI
jgi:DNA/RNA endonuclease YhcR with UshA esterase domain